MKINKYPLAYTYEQLQGKDLVSHKDGYLEYENTQFCKKGETYEVTTLEKDYLEFIDETNTKHGWDLYDVGEYFYPVDKVKDNLYNPVKNISREKYQRCTALFTSSRLFRSNRDGSCLWMHLSQCGKYYYWSEYNAKNKVIYFRGEVDWVESNYDDYEKVSKDDIIVSFDSDGVVEDSKATYVSNNTELKEEVMKDLSQHKTEWTDKHYDFVYKHPVTRGDSDVGFVEIKVDPYFVADQWKLGEKDNSGVIFHILKTCSRYKTKHEEEREIRAIYGQIKRLAELREVDLDE